MYDFVARLKLPCNLIVRYPRPPFVDNLVAHGASPSLASGVGYAHIMVSTAGVQPQVMITKLGSWFIYLSFKILPVYKCTVAPGSKVLMVRNHALNIMVVLNSTSTKFPFASDAFLVR